ncbi:MAG: hypothetical protein QT10_C0006G0038 [archaeon GW2011_AR19]|nr:MAG: hypothetical protein QT10_C0006G0038 [archaeon GW2011_AR19]
METKQISLEEIYQKLLEINANIKKFKKIEQYLEDLEFAKRTEEAWKEIDEGKYTEYSSPDEFLKTLKK